jgi:2-polyprenyl-3-methyl-5-hydroxy-6-metoxy-1,4-benzoquinol methylase
MSHHPHNPLSLDKENSYYEFSRPEVIKEITRLNLPCQRILELGCSTGATAKAIRELYRVDYYEGIELNATAAKVAADRLNKVQIANLETSSPAALGLPVASFDLLICLDILEHLYDPWSILSAYTECLQPGGHLLASIPNIQHLTILDGLVKGEWRYTTAGLLDATHLRFFTLGSIRELLSGAGLKIVSQSMSFLNAVDLSSILDSGNQIRLGKLHLVDLNRQEVLQFLAYQYILVAQKL